MPIDPEQLRAYLKKGAIVAAFFALALLFYALGWGAALKAYAVVVAIVSVGAILLQSGRGGGLATSLGGLGGDSLLGAHSATPIAKATYVMLALFVFICALVARLAATTPREEGPGLLRQAPPPAERTISLPPEEAPGAGEGQAPAPPAPAPSPEEGSQ